MKLIKITLKQMRVHNYLKNLIIFVPLVFSNNLFTENYLFLTTIAFLSFSGISSFVYIFNDLIDYNLDKEHPIKKNRPIASGAISKTYAIALSVVLLMIAFIICIFLNIQCVIILLLYLLTNLLYSLKLKEIPIIDVFCISLGFIFRLFIGAYAINVPLTHWLLLTIFCLSLFLGFGKRRNELIKVTNHNSTRAVLKAYSQHFLDKAMYTMVSLSIVFYALWSIDPSVLVYFNTNRLVYTVPIVVLAIFRYLLVLESDSHGDPTDIIIGDTSLKILILIYVIMILVFIYFK